MCTQHKTTQRTPNAQEKVRTVTRTHTRARTHTYTRTHTYIHTHTYMHTRIHMHTHTHTHTHVHTHTHTHTHHTTHTQHLQTHTHTYTTMLLLNCSMRVAVCVKNEVAVWPLYPATNIGTASAEECKMLSSHSLPPQDTVTALLWVVWGRQQRSLAPSVQCADSNSHGSLATGLLYAHNNACLLVGTSSGCVHLLNSSGVGMMRQRLHANAPVQHMSLRCSSMGAWLAEWQYLCVTSQKFLRNE